MRHTLYTPERCCCALLRPKCCCCRLLPPLSCAALHLLLMQWRSWQLWQSPLCCFGADAGTCAASRRCRGGRRLRRNRPAALAGATWSTGCSLAAPHPPPSPSASLEARTVEASSLTHCRRPPAALQTAWKTWQRCGLAPHQQPAWRRAVPATAPSAAGSCSELEAACRRQTPRRESCFRGWQGSHCVHGVSWAHSSAPALHSSLLDVTPPAQQYAQLSLMPPSSPAAWLRTHC